MIYACRINIYMYVIYFIYPYITQYILYKIYAVCIYIKINTFKSFYPFLSGIRKLMYTLCTQYQTIKELAKHAMKPLLP